MIGAALKIRSGATTFLIAHDAADARSRMPTSPKRSTTRTPRRVPPRDTAAPASDATIAARSPRPDQPGEGAPEAIALAKADQLAVRHANRSMARVSNAPGLVLAAPDALARPIAMEVRTATARDRNRLLRASDSEPNLNAARLQ